MTTLTFLPAPRHVDKTGGIVELPSGGTVYADPGLDFEALELQKALNEFAGGSWNITGTDESGWIALRFNPAIEQAQGYRLMVEAGRVSVEGQTAAGIYYGVCTLRQLVQQFGRNLPQVKIEDWPDYPARGVMLDISRDRVPTMETLFDLIDLLASWKVNEFQLYIEHTFAYRQHPEVWQEASPLTGEEIRQIDAYCRQRHIELVPNQNSLGHMERWLRHERYRHLAESPDGFTTRYGRFRPASTLNPVDPASIAFIGELYDELLPHFTSRKLNVGADEPWELGQGRSKPDYDQYGARVYLNYLHQLHRLATQRGFQMQFWADIIVLHPELVPELPEDVTAMIWGYEHFQPTEQECAMVANAGRRFYVCPGTSSWNSLVGRTDNAIENLRNAAELGLKYGAVGYLNTDWGDGGHWQALPVSYLGFAYGAALSWAYEANRDLDLQRVLDLYAFRDEAGMMGAFVYDLGNIYQRLGKGQFNGNMLVYWLDDTREEMDFWRKYFENLTGETVDTSSATLQAVLEELELLSGRLQKATMQRADADLIKAEFQQGIDLMKFSARRTLHLLHKEDHPERLEDLERLLSRQRELWLARSRPGGLADSLARFDKLRGE